MAVQYAFGKIITQGLDLNVDAADPTSYTSGSSSWISVVNRSITGSIISCSYSSDFKGGLVFNNQSASVQFPGTVANYGTGSFTIEMAFRPSSINGIHYLVSKNSGSFPNWGVYLSGSGGSGKLFAEYRINASVSCSVSSSTVFVTGSNYFVDTTFSPLERRTYISVDGNYDVISLLGNGTGSLTTTASLFLGNLTANSSQAYSGSIFSLKVYSISTSGFTNFKSISTRINKPIPIITTGFALIVAGGGAAGSLNGGGAGGVRFLTVPLTYGSTSVRVGAGGSVSGGDGQTSSFASTVSAGGGGGGNNNTDGRPGGSGGGGVNSGSGNTPFVDPPQGFDGGKSFGSSNTGAGGGGAGGRGFSPLSTQAIGPGGSGSYFDILAAVGYGSPIGWCGGGGAGVTSIPTPTSGGIGGGGFSGYVTPVGTGSANTGGGGGAGYYTAGGAGGSGIVIIRYPGPQIATGGTVTSFGGDTIHTFTATGSSTFTVF
jgi:hypothetical protein